MSLSMTLRKHEASEMGRNLPGDDLGMRRIRDSFQDFGNSPCERNWLKQFNRSMRMDSGRLMMMFKSILSRPGAELRLPA